MFVFLSAAKRPVPNWASCLFLLLSAPTFLLTASHSPPLNPVPPFHPRGVGRKVKSCLTFQGFYNYQCNTFPIGTLSLFLWPWRHLLQLTNPSLPSPIFCFPAQLPEVYPQKVRSPHVLTVSFLSVWLHLFHPLRRRKKPRAGIKLQSLKRAL